MNSLEERVGGKHEQNEEDREAQHQEAELPNAMFERILWALRGERAGNPSELCSAPRAAHDGGRGPADGRCAHKDRVDGVRGLVRRAREIACVFFDRIGFAGKQCLVDEEIACGEKAAIGRHDVGRLKPHDVSRHELLYGNRLFRPVAQRPGSERDRPAQCFYGTLGRPLLRDVDDDAQ